MQANTYQSPGTAGGNRESVSNLLTLLEPQETPFISMIDKKPATGTLGEVGADRLRPPRISGAREGKAAVGAGNKAKDRRRFGAYLHKFFDEYAVTDVQQAVAKAGGNYFVKNEAANAKSKLLAEVKRDMETAALSQLETQGGTDEDMQMRGYFKWVQAAAQTVLPVPDVHRPTADAILNPGGTLTEAGLVGVLKAMKQAYGKKINVDAFCGDDRCQQIDAFMRTGAAGNNTYVVNQNASAHQIDLYVTTFDTSFARVNVINDQFVGAATDGFGNPAFAALAVTEHWELQVLEDLAAHDLPDDASGERGYARAIAGLFCRSPRGQGAIIA